MLVDCLAAREVVVGEDFHFGHPGPATWRCCGSWAGAGFEVDGLGWWAPTAGWRPRRAGVVHPHPPRAGQGDLGTANALLGRPHEVRGVVAQGDKRGRELGFPTANVSVPGDILLPADGIYAGWFERADGSVHPAAISLGRRPTFYVEAHASLLEAHLLDFDGDLYDEHAKVRFVAWLRGEVSSTAWTSWSPRSTATATRPAAVVIQLTPV